MVRYHADPEFRRYVLDKRIEYEQLRRARDPVYTERQNLRAKGFKKQQRSREGYTKSEKLCHWIRITEWHSADLPWKSYRPELSPERISHHCSGCNRSDCKTRLWWSSIDSEKYLCSTCWWKLSWEEMCPRGFEDAATHKEFSARAKELGIEKPSTSRP